MPKFNILAIKDGVNYKFKVEKDNKSPWDHSPQGWKRIHQLTAISKVNALVMFKKRLESGVIDLPEINSKNKAIRKAIFCDFNGVLDQRNKDGHKTFHHDALLDVCEMASPSKIYEIAKLAIKHNAELVITSEWRKRDVFYGDVIPRVLKRSDNPIHNEFIAEFKKEIRELCYDGTASSYNDCRSDEIQTYINKYDITHCVTVEDSHPIKATLNPVMTHSLVGLEDKHVLLIDAILTDGSSEVLPI